MINLDTMTVEDLLAFAARHKDGANVELLFPQSKPVRPLAHLAEYARNKATAMQLRISGNIALAQDYEWQCERIYRMLPSRMKW